MALKLNKTTLNQLSYGKEFSFGRGILGRKSKNSNAVVMVLQKKLNGKPIKTKLGTYPDISLQEIESRAAGIRDLISQGINPKAHEDEEKRKREEDQAEEAARNITLREMVVRYEAHLVRNNMRGISPKTSKDRWSTMNRFFNQWLDSPIRNISKQMLTDWVDGEVAKGERDRAFRSIKHHLSVVINHAINVEDVMDKNPCAVFKGAKKRELPEKHALTVSHCNDLLEMVGQLTHEHHREQLVISLQKAQRFAKPSEVQRGSTYIGMGEISPRRHVAYSAIILLLLSGVRLQELLKLQWKDVYLEERKYKDYADGPFFRINQYKLNGKPTGIPITKYMVGTFKQLQTLRHDRFVFPSPNSGSRDREPLKLLRYPFETLDKLLPDVVDEVGQKLGANLLRHTFATTAARLRYTLDQIDQATGHTGELNNRNTATPLYIGLNADDNRDMFEAINRAMLGAEDILAADSNPH